MNYESYDQQSYINCTKLAHSSITILSHIINHFISIKDFATYTIFIAKYCSMSYSLSHSHLNMLGIHYHIYLSELFLCASTTAFIIIPKLFIIITLASNLHLHAQTLQQEMCLFS